MLATLCIRPDNSALRDALRFDWLHSPTSLRGGFNLPILNGTVENGVNPSYSQASAKRPASHPRVNGRFISVQLNLSGSAPRKAKFANRPPVETPATMSNCARGPRSSPCTRRKSLPTANVERLTIGLLLIIRNTGGAISAPPPLGLKYLTSSFADRYFVAPLFWRHP